MRLYRARLREQGITEYTIKLKKPERKKIERIAKTRGVSVTAAIEELIKETGE